uniref:barrier-to-autointegration factor B-like n=1 Tax=Semicossyphus pulcher TaxID=241346 RepID=UPI0037E74D04
MTSTTKKHRNFVGEPMGHKSVRDLPGIGDNLGQRLENLGFNKASDLLAKFLQLTQDHERFIEWLKVNVGANAHKAKLCTQCLQDWCDNNL